MSSEGSSLHAIVSLWILIRLFSNLVWLSSSSDLPQPLITIPAAAQSTSRCFVFDSRNCLAAVRAPLHPILSAGLYIPIRLSSNLVWLA